MSPTDAPDAGRFPLRRTILPVVLVVLLGLGALVGWTSRDDRPRAVEGRLIAATPVGGTRATVSIPSGTVEVTVTEPTSELPDNAGDGSLELRPPRRGSFVGVMLSPVRGGSMPMPVLKDAEVPRPEFALVADGRRYPLGPLRGSAQSRSFDRTAKYVAVAGSPRRMQLEVTYDGETGLFGVRDGESRPGRFAAIGTIPSRVEPIPCALRSASAGFDRAQLAKWCSVGPALRVPYVAGLGWVPRGKQWLAVPATVDPSRRLDRLSAGRRVSYDVRSAIVPAYRFGAGLKLATLIRPPHLVSGVSGPLLITAVGTDAPAVLTVSLAYARVDDPNHAGPGIPDRLDLKATWQATVR